jgi:hypothetical protein
MAAAGTAGFRLFQRLSLRVTLEKGERPEITLLASEPL